MWTLLAACWISLSLVAPLHQHARQRVARIGIGRSEIGSGQRWPKKLRLVGVLARLNRRVLDGTMPLEWMLERLLDAGYSGISEIEILSPKNDEEGYGSAISRRIAWLS